MGDFGAPSSFFNLFLKNCVHRLSFCFFENASEYKTYCYIIQIYILIFFIVALSLLDTFFMSLPSRWNFYLSRKFGQTPYNARWACLIFKKTMKIYKFKLFNSIQRLTYMKTNDMKTTKLLTERNKIGNECSVKCSNYLKSTMSHILLTLQVVMCCL